MSGEVRADEEPLRGTPGEADGALAPETPPMSPEQALEMLGYCRAMSIDQARRLEQVLAALEVAVGIGAERGE